MSAPPSLSCDEQEGSGIPAADHTPKAIISDTQHTLASCLCVLMDVFLGNSGLPGVMGESEQTGSVCQPDLRPLPPALCILRQSWPCTSDSAKVPGENCQLFSCVL